MILLSRRVTWAPFKSGEFLSSVKSDCFAIRFSVARSARNRFYRGKSAQYFTWRFRHNGETSGGEAGCYVIKDCVITATTSGDDLFGHVPFWGRSLCWHIVDTDTGSSQKSLLFYYITLKKLHYFFFFFILHRSQQFSTESCDIDKLFLWGENLFDT
jgi:hypothetical protein